MDKLEKAREFFRRLEGIDMNSEKVIQRKFEAQERLLMIRGC